MGYVPLKKTSASARKGQCLLVHTEIFKIYNFFQISLILYRLCYEFFVIYGIEFTHKISYHLGYIILIFNSCGRLFHINITHLKNN
jgi:hypothetical protein